MSESLFSGKTIFQGTGSTCLKILKAKQLGKQSYVGFSDSRGR